MDSVQRHNIRGAVNRTRHTRSRSWGGQIGKLFAQNVPHYGKKQPKNTELDPIVDRLPIVYLNENDKRLLRARELDLSSQNLSKDNTLQDAEKKMEETTVQISISEEPSLEEKGQTESDFPELMKSIQHKFINNSEVTVEDLIKLEDASQKIPDKKSVSQADQHFTSTLLERINHFENIIKELQVSSEENKEEIDKIFEAIKPLIEINEKRIELHILKKNLFINDHTKLLESFNGYIIQRLTSISTSMSVLSVGNIARKSSWKDDVGHFGISFSTSLATTIIGAVAAPFTWGLGSVLVVGAGEAASSAANKMFEAYRDNKKSKDFNRGTEFFGPDSEIIIRAIAYELTFLLQDQLKQCTYDGAKTIADAWIGQFYDSIQSKIKIKDQELKNKLDRILVQKTSKEKIRTRTKGLKWNTESLFTKSGVAFEASSGSIVYQYAHETGEPEKEITKTAKYGYLRFTSKSHALKYKGFVSYREKNCEWETRAVNQEKSPSEAQNRNKKHIKSNHQKSEPLDQRVVRELIGKIDKLRGEFEAFRRSALKDNELLEQKNKELAKQIEELERQR